MEEDISNRINKNNDAWSSFKDGRTSENLSSFENNRNQIGDISLWRAIFNVGWVALPIILMIFSIDGILFI